MKENSNLILSGRNRLYRNIYINKYDLDAYYMAKGHYICFPSFTSTSFKKGFSPTNNALNINHINNKKILLNIELSYKNQKNIIPQGMILKHFSKN